MKKFFGGKRVKMFVSILMVLALMVPMSALAWTQTNQYTVGGSGGKARMTLSLTKETNFMGATYFGCFAAKQAFYDANLRMEKFITTINTQCANSDNNRTTTSTATNASSGTARTKQVTNGYDDTGIVSFGLKFDYQSAAFGTHYFGRTVAMSQV